MFPDNDTATDFFTMVRWPNGVACPKCGSVDVQTGSAHPQMPYRCRDCRKQFSARTGTVMQSSKLPIRTWVIAAYLVTTSLKGISSMELHRALGITQKTAWHLGHRIRQSMGMSDDGFPFEGPVEADETFIGGKAKNMHAKKKEQLKEETGGINNKTPVIGIKDRKTKKIRAIAVDHVDGLTATVFVASSITPDVTVYTDETLLYNALPNQKASVNHGKGEYVRGPVSVNGMEGFWSIFKKGYIGTFHRMSPEHLHRYVQEFAGRHNDRDLDTKDQLVAILRGTDGKRLRYKDLIDHGGDQAVAI